KPSGGDGKKVTPSSAWELQAKKSSLTEQLQYLFLPPQLVPQKPGIGKIKGERTAAPFAEPASNERTIPTAFNCVKDLAKSTENNGKAALWSLEFCCISPQRSICLSTLEITRIVAVLLQKLAANPPGQECGYPLLHQANRKER
ncbi:unnamed protein product, partial [Bubo scandiacus]